MGRGQARYMPVGGQKALIVPPCGIQVGPGAVSGVITPRSLNQHVRSDMRTGNRRWEYKMETKEYNGEAQRNKVQGCRKVCESFL